MISNDEILNACTEILGEVPPRSYGTRERPFLTAYQIWLLLNERNYNICQQLEEEYGPAVGKGGEVNIAPAQRIAQVLERSKQIETHYLDTQSVIFQNRRFGNILPSGQDCGLFRLTQY